MEKKVISLTTKDGQPFEVTKEGSLGLLALGYTGIMIWRQKKQELANRPISNEENINKPNIHR